MSTANEPQESDYLKYRGNCKEYSEQLIKNNSELTLVRGYYYCPVFGKQAHWWVKDKDGNITDPTKNQFPSKGFGVYEEFDGTMECSECGKTIIESEAIIDGNGHYAFCSSKCNMKFVGV